jgi:hypothetical protein
MTVAFQRLTFVLTPFSKMNCWSSQHFKGPPYFNLSLHQDTVLESSDIPPAVPPFLACGDLSGWDESEQTIMDADKSYPIEQDYVAPIAPPILPPHQAKEMGENACKSTNWSCLVVTNARPSSDGGSVFQYHTNLCSSSVQRNLDDVILPLPNCISLLIKLYTESTFYLF